MGIRGIRSERRFIALANVEPGMIVDFAYTKLNGERGNYTVLVIEVFYGTVEGSNINKNAKEPKLHGYNITELSDLELFKLLASFKTTINFSPEDRRAPVVEELNTKEAYQAFKSMDNKRLYRTFNVSKIDRLRQVLLGSPD